MKSKQTRDREHQYSPATANDTNVGDLICRYLHYCYVKPGKAAILAAAQHLGISLSEVIATMITMALTREYTVLPAILSGLPDENRPLTTSRFGGPSNVADGIYRLFLSYRRQQDSPAIVGRIYDALVSTFSEGAVFRDIYSMQLGRDFRSEIQDLISKCDALIVLVDPHWLSGGNDARILDEHDAVRLEIEAALNCGVKVIPVLVNGAEPIDPTKLPITIRSMCDGPFYVVRPDPH